ncbi:hypothetical protein G6514_010077 [Epicoccum nigrum]|nr:hypothetical protein G6514_010077 [Epicoccum nigrum]
MIKDMTEDSLQMFTEILNAVDKLKKMTQGREGKDGNFGLVERVQWAVLKKPKLLVLRAAIEAYKTNLTLMLSTLSTAEKATRRSSNVDNAIAIAQDRQDRSLLQSLELDREATLIELAQAERRYEETKSPSIIDDVSPSRPPAYDSIVPDVDGEDPGLLNSARDEIQALRLSLPKTVTIDAEALEAKIVRHSKRISRMIETDKEKLSQRWSLTLDGSPDSSSKYQQSRLLGMTFDGRPVGQHDAVALHLPQTDATTAMISSQHDERRPGPEIGPRGFPQYEAFLSWILQFEPSIRRRFVRALREEIRQLDEQVTNKPG